jgi:hypothetical protein
MPSTILSDNGVTSNTSGIKVAGSNDGILELQTTTGGGTATTAITIDTGQRSKFPTTIGVGGATPSTSGSGISFPATQSASSDANTLDDYEEGTFTPTIIGTTAAGVGTYDVQIGRYTKIGNRVLIQINLIWTAHTGTGNMRISGLPFTTNSTGNNNWGVAALVNNMTVTGQVFVVNLTNSTELTVYSVNNGSSSLLAIDTAAQITLNFQYEV